MHLRHLHWSMFATSPHRPGVEHAEGAPDRLAVATAAASRRIARLLAIVVVVIVATPHARAAAQHAPAHATVAHATMGDTLSNPPVLRNISSKPHTVEVNITAAPARLALLPGHVTDVYAYNGSIPGPTLEAREGDKVIIHFHNALPEPTTVHWHGVHLPAAMDGSPFDLVPAGGHFDYVFTIQRGTAGTYWYHPHPDGRSDYQVGMGLFGAFIVRADDDPIPATIPDRVLVLSDNRFRPDGSIDFADTSSAQGEVDEENGREGNVLFVNGQIMPALAIRSGEVQRWHVINASASRVYRLAIPGQTLLHVGNDGGLFEHPVEVKDVVLANSERVELLVRGTGSPGSRAELQTLPYDRYVPQTRPANWNVAHPLLALRYSSAPPMTPVAVPSTLRRIPALDTTKATATHVVVLSQGMIDGRMMDMHRVDVSAPIGATEIWQVENVVGMDHPFHLHGFQFQVLDRNGVPEPFRSWKDVVNVPKHESVRFIVRYADYPGKWMFHCHILAHEDHGMMAILEVR
ncbi:MAG TPA: multicopper oxidase family protein [Candidatus Elarobacter sp.]|nr:multicopper oxidase family protein [Candidatus Elarobacter sp.]